MRFILDASQASEYAFVSYQNVALEVFVNRVIFTITHKLKGNIINVLARVAIFNI